MRTRSAKPFSSLVPSGPPADRLRARLPEAGFPRGAGAASMTGFLLLVLIAGFCALGLANPLAAVRGGGSAVPSGVVAAQRRDAETLAKAVAASATSTAHDLRIAVGSPALDDPDAERLLSSLSTVYPSWRGIALIDGGSRALLAARGEPVPVDSLSGVDLGRLTVRPATRPGNVPLALSAVPLAGGRTGQVLVVSTALRLPTSPADGGLRRHVRLVSADGTVLASAGADVTGIHDLLAAAAGPAGALTGPASPGPQPTAPVVAHAPVTTGAADLGLTVITATWLPADTAPARWPGLVPAAALLVLAGTGTLLLRRGLVRPIRRLRTDALAVAAGGAVTPARPRPRPARLAEARRLAAALERCRHRLHDDPASAPSVRLTETTRSTTTSKRSQRLGDDGGANPVRLTKARRTVRVLERCRRWLRGTTSDHTNPAQLTETRRTTTASRRGRRRLRGVRSAFAARGVPARLLVGLVTVALLGWAVAVACTLGRQYADVPAALVAEQGVRLDRAADALRSGLAGSLGELQAAARLSGGDQAGRLQPVVEQLAADPAFRSVYVADATGAVQQRAGREPLRGGPVPGGGGLHQHNTSGRVPVVYACAGLAGGRTLVGELDITRLAAPLQPAGARVRVVDGADRTIVDTRGYLAFAPLDDPASRAATAAVRGGQAPGRVDGAEVVTARVDGAAVVTARAVARGGVAAALSWVVVAEQPVGALGVVDTSVRDGARAAALLTAVLALLLCGWHELVVVRPLRRAAAAAEDVAAGGTEPGYPQRQDEIGTIASCVELCRLRLAAVPDRPAPREAVPELAGNRS